MKNLSIIIIVLAALIFSAACSARTDSTADSGEPAGTSAVTTGTRPREDAVLSLPFEDSGVEISDFEGLWACGKCMISIAGNDEGIGVDIIWSLTDSEYREWHYNCIFNGRRLFSDRKGERVATVFREDGSVLSSETDGAGLYAEFGFTEEGRLVWTESGEEAAEGMEFERVE